jgi:mitochondrial inner membrane protease subunit SOM1
MFRRRVNERGYHTSSNPTSSTSPSNLFPRSSAIPRFLTSPPCYSHYFLPFTPPPPKPFTTQFTRKMPPPTPLFPPHRLQDALTHSSTGAPLKTPVPDLKKDCALKELIQYECDLNGPREDPRSKVVCEPVLRLFRQ